jgi:hypothetical protein
MNIIEKQLKLYINIAPITGGFCVLKGKSGQAAVELLQALLEFVKIVARAVFSPSHAMLAVFAARIHQLFY